VLQCTDSTTLEEFCQGILVDDDAKEHGTNDSQKADYLNSSPFFKPMRGSKSTVSNQDSVTKRIPDVVIVKGLNDANQEIQIQALEVHSLHWKRP
jgi:hypothetical protein